MMASNALSFATIQAISASGTLASAANRTLLSHSILAFRTSRNRSRHGFQNIHSPQPAVHEDRRFGLQSRMDHEHMHAIAQRSAELSQ